MFRIQVIDKVGNHISWLFVDAENNSVEILTNLDAKEHYVMEAGRSASFLSKVISKINNKETFQTLTKLGESKCMPENKLM